MRIWLPRAVFAVLLFGSLAANERASDVLVEHGSLEMAVTRVARINGLNFDAEVKAPGTDIPGMSFSSAACPAQVLVFPVAVTLDANEILRSTRAAGTTIRYVYIDHSWESPRRLAMMVVRMKYAVLAVLGVSPYEPSWHMLLIEAPQKCKSASDIDWRMVWHRSIARVSDTHHAAIAKQPTVAAPLGPA